MTAPPSPLSGEFAGRYTVERELGRGATAIVYLARDRNYGRTVAIKVLRTELAESVTADRFLREINLTAQLHHPHIVPVLGSGDVDGRLYFALPYMDGGTLRDRLQRDKQLPIDDVIAIGSTILSALALAHSRNVLHRDVKPENILFTGGQACLSDFGIARAMERTGGESTTSTGLVRGTPAYMSPEQASGSRDYDGRSDLYSLACVLYEALAGVPAFIGATPQAVVAQRITHEPRPVRVYRPSVTPALEAVLVKALATAPADRYQTAEEFAAALIDVEDLSATARKPRRIAPIAVAMGALILAAIAFVVRANMNVWPFVNGSALDTTRIAVMPFDGPTVDGIRADNMVADALYTWRGLSPVESFAVDDAVRRFGNPQSADAARSLSRRLGAGRFIRGVARLQGERLRITTTLIDTRSGESLGEVTSAFANDPDSATAALRQLTDSLVLRRPRGDSTLPLPPSSRSLPATQLLLRGMAALGEWDLSAAESLYARALEYDPASSRAALWVAQIRMWQLAPTQNWKDLALRAVADSGALTPIERSQAIALAQLSERRFTEACETYQALIRRRPSGFVGWFGLAHCLDMDHAVVPDPRVATHWRFRSSYQRAIDAYVRAFELMPSVYRGYQGDAYSQLARILYVSTRTRRLGTSEGKTPGLFVGTPVLQGDTIAFVVSPQSQVFAAESHEDPAANARAVEQTRRIFHRIALGWATAFPSSAGAKHGLAVSLELRGDPASIDTLRSAIRLAPDQARRIPLIGMLAWLELKFGVAGSPGRLADARRLADSVLGVWRPATSSEWEIRNRLAALVGRCREAEEAARRSALDFRSGPTVIPSLAVGEAQARTIATAMRCLDGDVQSLSTIIKTAGLRDDPNPIERVLLTQLIGRDVRSAERLDTLWAKRLLAGGDYLLDARLAFARGHPDSARIRLKRVSDFRRKVLPGGSTPDAVVPEAELWLATQDTASAIDRLDSLLGDAAHLPPILDSKDDPSILIAFLVRAMALRADLSRSSDERRHWAENVATLWSGGDPGTRATVDRMRSLNRR